MNNKSISLGSIPKIRGTYTDGVIYHRENLVTLYGSLFQCIVSDTINTPPLVKDKEFDHGFFSVKLSNESAWKVVIDNIKAYNDLQFYRALGLDVDHIRDEWNTTKGEIEDRMPHYVYEDEWKAMTDAEKKNKLWYILKGNKPTEDGPVIRSVIDGNGKLKLNGIITSDGRLKLKGIISADGRLKL